MPIPVGETETAAAIKTRSHMRGLLASNAGCSAPDRTAYELALRGVFRTDLVLGNSVTRQFALIEAAEENGIFSKRQTGQYRRCQWSAIAFIIVEAA